MTVDQFLLLYKQNANKDEYVAQRVDQYKYVTYGEKVAICTAIVKHTMYEKITLSGEEVEIFKQNTPLRELFYKLMLIKTYSDIEIDMSAPASEYDKLNEKGLIYQLISSIPEKEYLEMDSILGMIIDDIIANERDLVSFLETKSQATELTISSLLDVLGGLKEEFDGENS